VAPLLAARVYTTAGSGQRRFSWSSATSGNHEQIRKTPVHGNRAFSLTGNVMCEMIGSAGKSCGAGGYGPTIRRPPEVHLLLLVAVFGLDSRRRFYL